METRNYALVEELLVKGNVDPNSCRNDTKNGKSTALEIAIANNDSKMVNLLLQCGVKLLIPMSKMKKAKHRCFRLCTSTVKQKSSIFCTNTMRIKIIKTKLVIHL